MTTSASAYSWGDRFEPNDSRWSATWIYPPWASSHWTYDLEITDRLDKDYFAFLAETGDLVSARLETASNANRALYWELQDSLGYRVTYGTTLFGSTTIRYWVQRSGTYYLVVYVDWLSTPPIPYRLEVSSPYPPWGTTTTTTKPPSTTTTKPPSTTTSTTLPGPITYQDFTGPSRYETSILISKKAYPQGAPVVCLVKGDNFPDALSAGPLAAAYGGPIVITPSGGLNQVVTDELKRLNPGKVFFIGLPDTLLPALQAALPGAEIVTIRGADRYETAAKIAEELRKKLATEGKSIEQVVIAAGDNFPDALSAGPLAAKKGWAILLTPQMATVVPAVTSQKISDLGATTALVVGTNVSLPGGVTVERKVGTDRYHTGAMVATYAKANGLSFSHIALAKGDNYPDALVVAPYLTGDGGILLLTQPTALPTPIGDTIVQNAADIRNVDFVGLPSAIQPIVKGLLP